MGLAGPVWRMGWGDYMDWAGPPPFAAPATTFRKSHGQLRVSVTAGTATAMGEVEGGWEAVAATGSRKESALELPHANANKLRRWTLPRSGQRRIMVNAARARRQLGEIASFGCYRGPEAEETVQSTCSQTLQLALVSAIDQ